MKFTNKQLCSLLFSPLAGNKLQCNTCKRTYKQGNGYTNSINHLSKLHPNYLDLAESAFRSGQSIGASLPDQRSLDIFRWVEWCIVERMPVSFCERPIVRKNARMEPISAPTLQTASIYSTHRFAMGLLSCSPTSSGWCWTGGRAAGAISSRLWRSMMTLLLLSLHNGSTTKMRASTASLVASRFWRFVLGR